MIRILISLLIGFSVFADDGSSAWTKVVFTSKDPLKERLIKFSLADEIFIPANRGPHSFVPPAQHIHAVADKDFSAQSKELITKVLNNLAVNLKDKSTRNRIGMSASVGVHNELQGRVAEYQYRDPQTHSEHILCIAVIQDHKNVHAIFLDSYLESLPNCTNELLGLSRSEVLYE